MVEKQPKTQLRRPRTAVAALVAVALLAGAALPVPTAADDRSLVKSSESEPYVMIILDTTGSMNRVPGGTDPNYATLCQDDPGSKMYQAKQALYQVIGDPDLAGVHFGFATFPNQEELRVSNKNCHPDISGDTGNCICEVDTGVQNNGCGGWEPNFGTTALPDDDVWNGMRLRYPTTDNPNDASYPAVMDYGDIIPMDWDSTNDKNVLWNSDNRRLIQRRLAPNLNLDGDNDGIPAYNDPDDPEAVPDFGVNSYFATTRNSNNVFPLLDNAARPLIARGSTPLARSLRNFNSWFGDWSLQAEANDPKFSCKQVHVIFITDGLDTCESTSTARQNEPPEAAAEVCAIVDGECTGPRVWAVGYSLSGTGEDVINNVAESGGTNACPIVQQCSLLDSEGNPNPLCCPAADNPDHAFFPTTQDDLVNAIKSILDEIRGGSRSFAAAAVPQGQANVSDKTYLASFIPIEDNPLWPGSLDAYLRPLPLTTIEVVLPDGTREERKVPDRADNCDAGEPSSCRLWDAGDRLILQAPTTDQLDDDPPDYNLGQGDLQRRIFYSVESAGGTVPALRKPFVPSPIDDADAGALMGLMGCGTIGSLFLDCNPANPGDPSATPPIPSNRERLHRVVRWVHEPKIYEVPEPDPDPGDDIEPGEEKSYLLGEIFHADPVVVGGPENFRYYAADLFRDENRDTRQLFPRGLEAACGDEAPATEKNPGFVCFFDRHRLRRKVVLVGSNDGSLHAFDGGVFDGEFTPPPPGRNLGVVTGRFTNGTGHELFSYIPRAMMPMLAEQSRGRIELYGVDGRVQVADVHIDVGAGPEWRTVAFGGMREGGAGYFALDVTQPDVLPEALDTGNIPAPVSSGLNNGRGYVPSCTNGGSGCGTLPYPSVLWEFYDLCTDPLGGSEPCDEDLEPGENTVGNGVPDLADGWSRPAIGIIEVCSSSTVPCPAANIVPKFVAVFGGGLDPEAEAGNFLYMVDVQTGKAIYKRQLEGALPSEVAVVDTDQDGVFDTTYVGTTAGLMYKVDMRTVPHLPAGGRITSEEWDPFPIFDTNRDDNGDRPIFFPPSVIFVTEVGRFALAFGTGYREDLWTDARANETGRFFVMLDQIVDESVDPAVVRPFRRSDAIGDDAVLPFGPANLRGVDPEGFDRVDGNLLLSPELGDQPGWWMELEAGEKVIAEPFALSGLLIFLTFQPEFVLGPSGVTCANTGQGRSFTVLTVNGNSIVPDDLRYTIVEELPTSPFTEKGVTKNPDDPSGGETEQGIPDDLQAVYAELKKLFPRNCRFSSYSVNVKTRRSDTGIHFIAPVPMCFQQKNWQGP